MPKATQEQIQQRVEKVLELRLAGATLPDIRQYASVPEPPDTPWEVSDRQLARYISQAAMLAKRLVKEKADRWLALHLLRRERLFAHAMETGDWSSARLVLADQAELLDLYPAKQVKHSGPKGDDPVPLDVTSGGQPLGIQLDPAAVAAFLGDVARLAGGVPADGAGQPLDSTSAPSPAAAIPPP